MSTDKTTNTLSRAAMPILALGLLVTGIAACDQAPGFSDEEEEETLGQTQDAVIDGTAEGDYRYPWVVSVAGGLSCKGVLIDPQWVLTAAHCVDSSNVPHVTYSRTDPTTGELHQDDRWSTNNPSRHWYIHPDYNPSSQANDIALVQLASPFVLDRWIQTIALPSSEPTLGQIGTIANFSHTDDLPDGQVAIYRAPIVGDSVCLAPNASVLCAQTPNAGLCTGDSGSGFSRVSGNRASVLGIAAYTQYQSGCDTPGHYAGLTGVFPYRSWLFSTMNKTSLQLSGNARMRWTGQPSSGTMRLSCETAPWGLTTGTSVAPMNAPGAEVRLSCPFNSRVRAVCDLGNTTNLAIGAFEYQRTDGSGVVTTTQLAHTSSSGSYTTSYAGPTDIREFTCSVNSAWAVETVGATTN